MARARRFMPFVVALLFLSGFALFDIRCNGFACIGGQAFRKIPSGWEQVYAQGGGWQRCTGG